MRNFAFWASLILVFMIPWENSVVIKGLGSLPRLVGLIASAFWAVTVLATGKIRRPHPFYIVASLFVLWQYISLIWTVDYGLTIRRVITFVQLLFMVWIIWDLYTTSARIKAGLQVYILGAYVSIYYTLQNYFAGNDVFNSGRFSGAGLNANDLALILALGLPVAWHLAVSISVDSSNKKMQVLKLVNYAYLPLALFSILLTASRTALFTTLPAFWFVLGSSTRLKLSSRVILSVGFIGALILLQPLLPQSALDRLGTASEEIESGDLNGRVDLWREGLPFFLENPITGIGSGAYRAITYEYQVAHNTYLTLLVEGGIISFALFASLIAISIHQFWRQPGPYSALWVTILLIWAIGVFVLSWDYRKPTWLFLSLIIVSTNLLPQRDPPVEQATVTTKSFGLTKPIPVEQTK